MLPPGVGTPHRSENGYRDGYAAFIAWSIVRTSFQVPGTLRFSLSRTSVRTASE